MERLVLVYDYGSEWEGGTDTLPFIYSSKIEAELFLLEKWEEYNKAKDAFYQYNDQKHDLRIKDYKKFYENQPPSPKNEVQIGNHTIDISYFGIKDFHASIYTLEEWFESYQQ
jgi:hypothetical protein